MIIFLFILFDVPPERCPECGGLSFIRKGLVKICTNCGTEY